MKVTIAAVSGMFAALTSLASVSGCGFAARSPEMYRDDAKRVLEAKSHDIQVCYDGVLTKNPGVAGKVTITFEVETDNGKITNVKVDSEKTTAPANVAECVIKNVEGLALTPPDQRVGQGTWVYEFNAPVTPSKS